MTKEVKGAPHDIPLPPSELMQAVAGTPDTEWFLKSGRLSVEYITMMLEKNGVDINHFQQILDFGCGSGRVLRQWPQLEGRQFYGSDYNPRLIDWCKRNLKTCIFNLNGLKPGLPWRKGSFDFIYAISVFTHLTEELQVQWMGELRRLLRSGGYLLFTTHGKHYSDQLSENDQQRFSQGELVVGNPEVVGTNNCGAFHPPEYVRGKLSSGFTVVDFSPSGFTGAPYQDCWLLQKSMD